MKSMSSDSLLTGSNSTTTAVIIVTRNNPALIEHAAEAYKRHDPGVPVKYIIANNDGRNDLTKVCKKLNANCHWLSNDRVEKSFDLMAEQYAKHYNYLYFAHDDCVPMQDNWLLKFHERMQSGYCEPEAPEQFKHLPIARVGASHQYWRDYESVKGHPVQCHFLGAVYELLFNSPAPVMFKYCDVDRVLVSGELTSASHIVNTAFLKDYAQYHSLQDDLKTLLDHMLPYKDEGTYPKELYPAGHYWSKLTLVAEMLNSLLPLTGGYRTVGLEGDGYLEELDGQDPLFGHNVVAHYGAPNALQALSKHFNLTTQQVKSQFNNAAFLQHVHRFFKDRIK